MLLLSHLPLVFILKPLFEGGVMMAYCPLAEMSELSSNHISRLFTFCKSVIDSGDTRAREQTQADNPQS